MHNEGRKPSKQIPRMFATNQGRKLARKSLQSKQVARMEANMNAGKQIPTMFPTKKAKSW